MRSCDCNQWQELRLKQLGYTGTQYPEERLGVELPEFLFCPWCGVRLNAPCANCGEPSNKDKGNTIYWQDEENYCSVECGLKMVKGGSTA